MEIIRLALPTAASMSKWYLAAVAAAYSPGMEPETNHPSPAPDCCSARARRRAKLGKKQRQELAIRIGLRGKKIFMKRLIALFLFLGLALPTFAAQIFQNGLIVSNSLAVRSGTLSVGTNTPTHKVHIASTTNDVVGIDSTGTDSASMLHIRNIGVQGPFFDFEGANGRWGWGVASGGPLQLRVGDASTDPVNGTTRLAISTNGNLLVTNGSSIGGVGLTNGSVTAGGLTVGLAYPVTFTPGQYGLSLGTTLFAGPKIETGDIFSFSGGGVMARGNYNGAPGSGSTFRFLDSGGSALTDVYLGSVFVSGTGYFTNGVQVGVTIKNSAGSDMMRLDPADVMFWYPIIPQDPGAIDIGSSSSPWRNLYAKGMGYFTNGLVTPTITTIAGGAPSYLDGSGVSFRSGNSTSTIMGNDVVAVGTSGAMRLWAYLGGYIATLNLFSTNGVTAVNGPFNNFVKPLSFTSVTNVALDASLGNKFSLTLTTNAYFTQPSNLAAMQDIVIDVRQDAIGGRTVGFDTNYWKFSPSGQITPVSTNAGAWNLITAIVGQYATNVAVRAIIPGIN